MSSLTECFKRFGVHPIEQTRIRKIAKAYREDGVKAVEAQNKAVLDYVKGLEDEGGQIINQIKGRFTVEKVPEVAKELKVAPKEEKVSQGVPKETLPITKETPREVKEPYLMTLEEYKKQTIEDGTWDEKEKAHWLYKKAQTASPGLKDKWDAEIFQAVDKEISDTHKKLVEQAKSEGREIPQNVMEEYPEPEKVEGQVQSIPAEPKTAEKIVEPEKPTKEVTTPKTQKKYLIDAIDEAIKEAPEHQELVYLPADYVRIPDDINPAKSDRIQKITPELEERFKTEGKKIEDYLTHGEEGRKINLEKTPHVLIEVPGDGDFRVVNSKEALEGFKKLAEERFPGGPIKVSPEAARKLPEKPTGRRISPKDNQEYEYVAEYTPKRVSGSEYVDQGKAYVGRGWFGDGNYIVRGEAPKGFGGKLPKKDLTEENIKKVMPSLKDYKEAKYLTEFHLMNSTKNEGLAIHEGMATEFQPHYMDIVKNRYPDSKVFIKDEESPIIIKQDKDIVGLVMPLRGAGLAEPVKEFLRNEGIKFQGEARVEGAPPETKEGIL